MAVSGRCEEVAGPLVGMSAFVCDENTETWVITQLQACQSQGHDDMSSMLCRGKKQCVATDKVVTKNISLQKF